MKEFVCIFEDKKFSNFFPLSLSQPVFELRIGGKSFRTRMLDDLGAERSGVLCREYLAPLVSVREEGVMVNQVPDGEIIFLNGRLLCLGDELHELLSRVPENGMAVKGGYVVAARLSAEAARSFAEYIQSRVSEQTIDRLCEELRAYAGLPAEKQSKKGSKKFDAADAGEGTDEDDHAVGQDNVAEKLPKRLLKLIDDQNLTRMDSNDARLLSFPWQIIDKNPAVIEDDFQKSPFRGQSEESVIYPGVQMVGEENIVVGESAVIRPGAVLDASSGPIIINDGTTVMANACILGPVYVGKNSLIKTGAKILEGTSVGDVCKIGGEVDQTIFANYSNKQHDGFIGHSYIGEWVNIGAGSNNSDLKNNYSSVRMWCAGVIHETGRQFLGCIIGDHTKIGIGAVINSGTVIGFASNVYGSDIPDRFIPSFSWGKAGELVPYETGKALLTAQVVTERRNVKFDDAYKSVFKKIVELSERCARNI